MCIKYKVNNKYILFRIKKGCLLEVEVTTVIMAKVLTDIFPTSYVLMRVVGEFLSPNQPHPTSMCIVVNQVCILKMSIIYFIYLHIYIFLNMSSVI